MITVLIKSESHYTVNRKRIRDVISRVLLQKGMKFKTEVSVNIVGDRQMRDLNNKYRKLDETTDVLSFPLIDDKGEVPFADLPDHVVRLGDIVISFPQAREDAMEENKMIDDKIDELVKHSMLHLLGQHHEE